jgi:hypothetical protein
MPKFAGIINQEENFVTLDRHVRMPQDVEYSEDKEPISEQEPTDSDSVNMDSDEETPKTTKRGKK